MPLDLPPPRDSRFGSPLVLSCVNWVRPELVAEVKFLTWTEEGLLRHAIYQGLREDKPETGVRRSPMHGALRRLPEPALPKGKPATGARWRFPVTWREWKRFDLTRFQCRIRLHVEGRTLAKAKLNRGWNPGEWVTEHGHEWCVSHVGNEEEQPNG
jgi:ATP dependent DNA ligase C terminal region